MEKKTDDNDVTDDDDDDEYNIEEMLRAHAKKGGKVIGELLFMKTIFF